jgi:hypothetical protein
VTRIRLLAGVVAVTTSLSACAWGQIGANAAHDSWNRWETSLTTANVGRLRIAWQAEESVAQLTPVMANGLVYAGHTNEVDAFAADGGTGCSGTPRTCRPQWTASFGHAVTNTSIAVVDGAHLFVTAVSGSGFELAAFDALGAAHCSGHPKRCSPVWTSTFGDNRFGYVMAPVVADGRVFVAYTGFTAGGLLVFDEAGRTACSGTPTTCAPTNVIPSTSGAGIPAIDGGWVYAGRSVDGGVFDESELASCGDSCVPSFHLAAEQPNVQGGLLYKVNASVEAYDATGRTNCGGTPVTCQPVWRATGLFSAGSTQYPTLAAGRLFVIGGNERQIGVFDAPGIRGCDTLASRNCSPLATIDLPGIGSASSATANLLFVSSWLGNSTHDVILSSYDVHGVEGCGGPPPTCTSVASLTLPGFVTTGQPAIAGGRIAIAGGSGALAVLTVAP